MRPDRGKPGGSGPGAKLLPIQLALRLMMNDADGRRMMENAEVAKKPGANALRLIKTTLMCDG